LRHFVRPYQNFLYDQRVASIHFVNSKSAQYSKSTDIRKHYFSAKSDLIYSDKIAKFACEAIKKSAGAPLRRLEQIFDHIFVDESQDLAGYDLDLIELLLKSKIQVTLVGDHRQATYSTNSADRHKQYRGADIVKKFQEWGTANLCEIEYQNFSHRCIQPICDFADQFHPSAPKTVSKNENITAHDGIFAVRKSQVVAYADKYSPQTLQYNRTAKKVVGKPINYGAAKGMTFERTLVYPHGKLTKFLETGKLDDAGKELDKIYVAITRAKQSVAFVVDDNTILTGLTFYEF
jgi:DNA helicase-2/ATP-dependent DNA helicase PcrA